VLPSEMPRSQYVWKTTAPRCSRPGCDRLATANKTHCCVLCYAVHDMRQRVDVFQERATDARTKQAMVDAEAELELIDACLTSTLQLLDGAGVGGRRRKQRRKRKGRPQGSVGNTSPSISPPG
jgi:hypothetical protein